MLRNSVGRYHNASHKNLLAKRDFSSAPNGMSATQTTPSIGPHSRPHPLAKMDQRTKEARLLRELRAELTAHVGDRPSATQRALIEQAVQIRLRLAMMDRKFAKIGEMTEHDSRTYLAWSNSYSRLLRQLGLKGAAEKPQSLAEILAEAAAPATEAEGIAA